MTDICWAVDPEIIHLKVNETVMFQVGEAAAHLLLNEVLFLNSRHWRKDAPKDIRNTAALFVICNDVFSWGSADAEELPFDEVEKLYDMWAKDPAWGPAVWCAIRRKQMPQAPVEKAIRDAGIWDLDVMGLNPNWQDDETHALFARTAAESRGKDA